MLGLLGDTAKKISAAYDDRDLDSKGVNFGEFSGDFVNAGGIDSEALLGGKGLAGELQQNAFENGLRHLFNISA
jgi:hypothetical protein